MASLLGVLFILAGGSGGGNRGAGIGEIIAMTLAVALSIAVIMIWAFAPFYILLWFPNGNIIWVGPVWWLGTLLLNKFICERVKPTR